MLALDLLSRRATIAGTFAVALGAGIIGCAGSDDGQAPQPAPGGVALRPGVAEVPSTAAPATSAKAPVPPVLAQHGTVGARRADVTLTAASAASRPKTRLAVRVLRLRDPIRPTAFQRHGLRRGQRYVGVELRLRNVGASAWSGAPAALATLLTRSGVQAAPSGPAGASCGGPFARRVELSPGAVQVGCLTFIVPAGAKPALFQLSPDYPTTPPAEWPLGR
jgi:hypothetical protein